MTQSAEKVTSQLNDVWANDRELLHVPPELTTTAMAAAVTMETTQDEKSCEELLQESAKFYSVS
jgi:hypothetical protein